MPSVSWIWTGVAEARLLGLFWEQRGTLPYVQL